MYFYELREGDEDIYTDLVLVRDDEMPTDEFFTLVQAIRGRIVDSYEDDTLIEAIAAVLERDHGFVHVSDKRLVASVNVSESEQETYLVATSDETAGADFRGILVDWDPDDESPLN
ncbi:MAG TPA: hypothetical protein VJZ72_08165 [Candidatus Limnocylindrales bacterium]|nr:hypothetical protein [Candidatus Limnocylindrales bacterium]